MMTHFGEPFLTNVFERCRGGDAEAYEKHVGLGIRQRAETIVVLLTSGVKETKGVGLIANPNCGAETF